MKRTVDVEIELEQRRPVWLEGTLEIAEDVAKAYEKFAPFTMLEVSGEYFRPDRHTKILRVATPPKVLQTPLDRAAGAWSMKDAASTARFLQYAADEPNSRAWSLRAALALHEGREEDARAAFLQAIDREPSRQEFALAEVYFTLIAKDAAWLDERARRALLGRIYSGGRLEPEWRKCVHLLVASTYEALLTKVSVPPPWHFGGPCVSTRPDHPSIVNWVRKWLESVATQEEAAELSRLDHFTPRKLEAYCKDIDVREEKLDADARDAAVEEWHRANPDRDDSAPDHLGDSGPLESDGVPYAWAQFLNLNSGRLVVRVLAEHKPLEVVRAFALGLDATVILASVAPDLAAEVERVVLVEATTEQGLAIARMKSGFCLLLAKQGAFGTWAVVSGTREQIRDAVPAALAERAMEAMSRTGDGCDFV